MKLDRTTIQKAIKKLVEKDLANRIQNNISKGGYTFLYTINNKEEIKNKIKETIRRWSKAVEEVINNI